MSLHRADILKIYGLLALLLGLVLVDRSFANWRNDVRNFPNQNGVYLPAEADTPPRTFFQDHRVLTTTTGTGIGLLVLSVVLLGKNTGTSEESSQRSTT